MYYIYYSKYCYYSILYRPSQIRVCVSLSAFFILILFLAQTASLTTMMLTGRNFCDPASYCHTVCLRRTPLLMCDPFVVANLRVECNVMCNIQCFIQTSVGKMFLGNGDGCYFWYRSNIAPRHDVYGI